MAKLKFKSNVLKSVIIFFIIFFDIYIYIYKCLKMYQLNIIKKIKKDVKKKTDGERYQNFSKERKKQKGNNMVVNATKTSQTMNNKSLLSIEKSIIV